LRVKRYFLVSILFRTRLGIKYTLSETWSGVNWADLMAAQGAFSTDFYDRSSRTIVGTMLWTEYGPVIKIDPKGALGSHEIRPIHSAPSLGQSIEVCRIVIVQRVLRRDSSIGMGYLQNQIQCY